MTEQPVSIPHGIYWPYIEDRAQAAFLGLAIGDAFGATTEFMTPMEIKAKYGVLKKIVGGGWLYLRPGRVTDDTEMSVCIARAIHDCNGWDLQAVAENFSTWMKGRPVDIGSTCARGIREFMHKGTLEAPYNEWSAGNGGVMRMAPVALATLGDDQLLERWGLEQARITHNHPLSDAACVTVGRMVQQAMLGHPMALLRETADELVASHATFRFKPYVGNSSAYVVDTMQTVLHYLFATDSFEDCLICVVNQGGDADTTGAIAGMIAGAYYGKDAFPRRWVKRLDPRVREEVMELGRYLVNCSPLAAKYS